MQTYSALTGSICQSVLMSSWKRMMYFHITVTKAKWLHWRRVEWHRCDFDYCLFSVDRCCTSTAPHTLKPTNDPFTEILGGDAIRNKKSKWNKKTRAHSSFTLVVSISVPVGPGWWGHLHHFLVVKRTCLALHLQWVKPTAQSAHQSVSPSTSLLSSSNLLPHAMTAVSDLILGTH